MHALYTNTCIMMLSLKLLNRLICYMEGISNPLPDYPLEDEDYKDVNVSAIPSLPITGVVGGMSI